MEFGRILKLDVLKKFGFFPRPRRAYMIDPKNPEAPPDLPAGDRRMVLVIGAGLAGLSASLELAERGYSVKLKEARPFIGGKISAPRVGTKEGEFNVEHGLHMWFYNYFNAKDTIDRIGARKYFRDYHSVNVMFREYQQEIITSKPPIYPLNLLSILWRSPNVGLMDMRFLLEIIPDLMYYEHETVYDRLDDITFDEWARKHGVTDELFAVLFEPGASVTINDPKTISAAELVMWTHYFFIGHPKAMWREIATEDHWTALLGPWLTRLKKLDVDIVTGEPVSGLRFRGGKAVSEKGSKDKYDWIVLASDVAANKEIMKNSHADDDISERAIGTLNNKLKELKIAPAYRIIRAWFDRKPNPERPDVIETPQFRPLHLLAQFHLLEGESKAWSERTGGSVIEFHFYADPRIAALPENEVWNEVEPVILQALPELKGAKVLDTVIGTYHNFTSYDVGQGKIRPHSDFPVSAGISNLFFAGDWVQTAYPSALMERAVSTGREAANHILLADNVRQVPLKVASSMGPGLL